MIETPTATELITCDPDILWGTPVFTGTRVPVESLFDYPSAGDPLDVFLDDFPTVSRAQAVAVLTASIGSLTSQVIHSQVE